MRKIYIILSIIFLTIFINGCQHYHTEITKLYDIVDYKIHNIGVEIWTGTEENFFILHENIYINGEEPNVVVAIYEKCYESGNIGLKGAYLYLNEDSYKSYLKERYDL